MSIVSDNITNALHDVHLPDDIDSFNVSAGEYFTLIEIYSNNTFNHSQFLPSAHCHPHAKNCHSRAGGNRGNKSKITLQAKAQVNHILIHSDHLSSFSHLLTANDVHPAVQIMHLDIHQEADSIYQATIIASGDTLQHLHIQNYLSEPNAQSDIRILNYGRSNQKISVESTAHHIAAYTSSNTTARGIMDDKAKGNFTGKIIVREHSAKTIAKLENKNILLSKLAEMNTRPLLEVYNGDIQCSHGATVGYLDEEALFYLRSRGINEEEARTMLTKAFMAPVLQHLHGTPDWFTAIEDLF
jgi:Fe-S cluster assembly scaffold protein SufB